MSAGCFWKRCLAKPADGPVPFHKVFGFGPARDGGQLVGTDIFYAVHDNVTCGAVPTVLRSRVSDQVYLTSLPGFGLQKKLPQVLTLPEKRFVNNRNGWVERS
jgi:hypothetical protein